jgi:hypothetical protein
MLIICLRSFMHTVISSVTCLRSCARCAANWLSSRTPCLRLRMTFSSLFTEYLLRETM